MFLSCNPLGPAGGSAQSTVEINAANLPAISIPLNPAEAETEFADAKTFMNQKILVPNNDSKPDVYYVVIFITNVSDYDRLVEFYVPYSVMPFPGFETNTNTLKFLDYEGVFTGEGYSNVVPHYALITSAHYNYFMENNTFIFKPIRKMTYSELSNIGGIDTSFISEYQQRIEEKEETVSNKSITKSKFKVLGWFESFWGTVNDIVGAIGSLGVERAQCSIKFTYNVYDESIQQVVSGIVPGIWGKFFYANGSLGSFSQRVGNNGSLDIYLPKNTVYKLECEITASYAYCSWALVAHQWIYIKNIPVGSGGIQSFNVSSLECNEVNYGFLMGTFYELSQFAKANGINPGQVNCVLGSLVAEGNWSQGGPYFVLINPKAQYNKQLIAHEYGHFLNCTVLPIGTLAILGLGYLGDPPIIFPDNQVVEFYSDSPIVRKCEGWADFFSVVFLINKYKNVAIEKNELCRAMEANLGSKEIFYQSLKKCDNSLGTNGQSSLYGCNFIRYYKDASILYDLWDKNEYQGYFNQNELITWISGFASGSYAMSAYKLISVKFYPKSEYSNSFSFAYTYDKANIIDREYKMDKLSMPLNEILFMVIQSMFVYDKNLDQLFNGDFNSIHNVAVIQGLIMSHFSELKSIAELHSQSYPVYQPGIYLNLTNLSNPDGSITLSWSNISVLAQYKIRKKVNGFLTAYYIVNGNAYNGGNTYNDNMNLQIGKTNSYTYCVIYNGVESPQSEPVMIVIPRPPVPSGISVTPQNNGSIKINWNPVNGAVLYKVFRTANGLPDKTISIAVKFNQYIDTNLITNKTYHYSLIAMNYAGDSTNSTPINATPLLPNAPSGLKIGALNNSLYKIEWDVVSGANLYYVQKRDISNGQITNILTANNWYEENPIDFNKAYEFKVWAKNLLGQSTNYSSITVHTPDTNGPIVNIISPTNNHTILSSSLSSGNISIYGIATEGGILPVSNVFIKLDTGVFQQISMGSLTNFNFTYSNISTGIHTVSAYCVDNSGKYSLTNIISCYLEPVLYQFSFGELGSGDGQFNAPQQIFIDNTGYLYITEKYNYRVQKFSTNGSFIYKFGQHGTNQGQFGKVSGITVTKNGIIAVADFYQKISFFNSINGSFISRFSTPIYNVILCLDSDESNRIIAYYYDSPPYNFSFLYNQNGTTNKLLNFTTYYGCYDCTNYYIAYSTNVSKYNKNGSFVSKFGVSGTNDNQFTANSGIIAYYGNYLYILDSGKIKVFTKSGAFVYKFTPVGGCTDIAVNGSSIFIIAPNNVKVYKKVF
jgi:hypothetical protein